MTKEDFCYNCNFITFYPHLHYPLRRQRQMCIRDRDNTYCPRHDGWLEELEDEE